MEQSNEETFDRIKEKHSVWHKFVEFLEKEYGEGWETNLHGHEAIEKIEKYASENPEICIAYCDDNHFASSILVVVPHKDMGNTVIFVPQLTTVTNNFFLYPNHQKSLLEALNKNTHKHPYSER